jgi:hypothetical protein
MHVTLLRLLGTAAPTARTLTALVVALMIAGAGLLPAAANVGAQQDNRYFQDTGFRIDNDKIWDYFSKRGGQRTFGLPTSRTFQFMGLPTQFFQRHVLQATAGGVQPLNLLDEGLLPYNTIGGSTFPEVDPAIIAAAPKAGSASYVADVQAFMDAHAPDTWDGEPVKFTETFDNTVTLADAFPDGGGNASLLTLLNLEIWGLPTAKPARDPNNNDFIFARFQRGVMHYNVGCKCTQGLLLGDALKELITGENLPDDLASQAADSPLFEQYDMSAHNGPLHAGLPGGTDLANAFRPSLDTTAAGTVPPISAGPAASGSPKPGASPDAAPVAAASPTPKPAPSGPPSGDPKVFLTKASESGKGAEEKEKEAKSGKDDRMVWASNRIERERTWANYNSGPVTIYSKSIITQDPDTAKAVFEEEAKQNEKFPEAKDKVGGKFEFNTEGDEDVGEEAKGLSACEAAGCVAKDEDNKLHRRMVFRINRFVGVIYTYGMDAPEGNTQAFTRQFAARMVKKMRDSI